MIAELGLFSLALALAVALALAAVPMIGAQLNRPTWMAQARPGALLLFALCSLSFGALLRCYAVSDFSVEGVAVNSEAMMPLVYRLAAAWGNHEGSMLMWVWILSLWGALVAWRGKSLPPAFLARALSVQGMIGSGFLLFVLFASNPFARLDPPAPRGMGLNPVLQDPALAIHPPLLYTGYVGFSVAFCFAMAALLGGSVDKTFAKAVRPWALAAWAFLTVGICKGAIWAYYTLGWGGFWFWDPVENASLMPWLCGTALVHALTVLARRDTLRGWTVFLAILSFSFALLGTFLVRSGILTSVHTFAVDPRRGIFILALLALAIGGAFTLFAVKAPRVPPGAPFAIFSRETAMLLNNVFLSAICATVFMGTLYPVFMSALGRDAVSVGPPYYLSAILPLLVPFTVLMGLAPHVAWRQGDMRGAIKRLVLPLLVALAPAAVTRAMGIDARPLILLGAGMGGWVIFATLLDLLRKGFRRMPTAYYGMVVAHLGFAVFLLGATASTQGTMENIQWLSPNDRIEIAGRTVDYLGPEQALGPDYNIMRAVFQVTDKRTGETYFMAPEKRWYPGAGKETSETALHLDATGVLYLVLGEEDKELGAKRRVVRVYYHPLVLLVFGGGLLMALGGALAALDRGKKEDA